MEVTVRQKVENGVALLATALSVYFGYWPLALPAAFLFWDAYREHHKLRLAELQKVRRLTEHALVSIALLIVVSLPLAIKELVAPRFAEHHLNPRPEVSAPRTAFLEAMQPEMRPGYSRIAPGELLSATTKWANRTKERVFKAASWVAAYVEHVDGETERRVHRRFAEESALGKSSYYAGKTGGAEVAPDFAIGGIPRTPPLTREQCDSLLRGTARLYLISWAGWTDSFGRRDSASQCEWIETPDTNITDGKWHYCDE